MTSQIFILRCDKIGLLSQSVKCEYFYFLKNKKSEAARKMKGLPLLLASLLVITSCSNSNDDKIQLPHNVKQIIFFSNDQDYSEEAAYYDALIELKKEFPAEIRNMLVISPTNAKPYFQSFHINACPALLVIYNDKVMIRISGKVSKEQIIQPISEILSSEVVKNNDDQ